MPNARLLSSIVSEIALIQFSFVVLKGPSNCRNHAIGDKAYNRLDTLEDTVKDCKKVEEVWNAFEKSFEQSTSFWHFRDAYLGDFRQDESETTADLDLHIKQTVRGCQWKKDSEEGRMIDLLYHATIYYEIRKFIQESKLDALTY